MLSYAAKTDIGNQRSNNEDCFLASPELCLWVMADGVGGQDAGEIASRIVCNVIKSEIEAEHGLDDAINMAHQAVKASPAEGVGRPGMASTVVALLVHGSDYQVSWVGDSRAYLWSNNELAQLSHDQSLVQRLIDEEVITEEEAQNHPRRNLVIQALGQQNLDAVEVETARGKFKEGDLIILCSDGLTDYVTDAEIQQYIETCSDETALVDQLIDAALATEGKDNITVLAVNMKTKHIRETQQMQAVSVDDPKAEAETVEASSNHIALWLASLAVIGAAAWWFIGGGLG
ncbi:PP2C family protein-serine/threonine phosphatase [Oceanicoccus sagamiensis]|uniref:PPM-type phosphatase domain-containing protein n=1 Tax=Oceanicoccus sagamiensis TaxID=716816 RepID=A0A1X9NH29_9GAMM|nr:protein phosphatase 2C domain-containing protein [Oceanicoccus sagamiensis]ARN74237.1 hypothetical protein BST96_08950 [Oceanicoccus sagamiensis]